MNTTPEIPQVEAAPWSQDKVEMVRRKLNELAGNLNTLLSIGNSICLRVLSGELRATPARSPLKVHTFTGASVAEEVAHGLGFVPAGYLIVRSYPIGSVGDADLASWNTKTVFLQTDTPGLTVTLLFF